MSPRRKAPLEAAPAQRGASRRGPASGATNGKTRPRRRRGSSDPVAETLATVFPGISLDGQTDDLVPTPIAAGEQLCRQGDDAEVAWVVIRGRLRVFVDAEGGMVAVGDVGPGSIIGEAGLLEGAKRNATVIGRRDAVVVAIDRTWVAGLIGNDPGAIGRLLSALGDRPTTLETAEQVVTLLPAGAPDAEFDALIEQISTVTGTAVVRASDAAATAAGSDHDWLSSLERANRRVVLVGDDEWTEWTDRIVRAADRVVTVTDATAAGMHPTERHLRQVPDFVNDSRTVVFVHPARTVHPQGTSALLAERPGFRHLHACAGNEADRARVARHLTGTAVCLVLSGGGARALASIGVYRELRRRGIPIDAVSGSSAGAVLAGCIARGSEPDDLLRRARDGFLHIRDPTIPVASILRGRRLWNKLGEHLGDDDIEDCWIPFACVTTDITEQTLAVHDRGSLRVAVRASVSLPGVFAPIDIDGHLHVDGGLLDNLPVAAGEHLAPGATIIAADVSPPTGPAANEPLPTTISGASLLLDRLFRRSNPSVPSLAATIAQSVLLPASRARQASLDRIDCHLDLQLPDFGLLEFGKLDRIVDIGGRQTIPLLDEWLEIEGNEIPTDDVWVPTISVEDGRDPDLETSVPRAILGSLYLAVADLRFRLRRFVVAMVAASVVLALLLLMTGVVNELDREPAVTTATIGATHWVLPEGIESPFTSNATIDEATAAAVVAAGAVRPALVARLPVAVNGETIDAILIGHAADGPGVPEPKDGRAAAVAGEVALSSFAGASVGDEIGLGGTTALVVGSIEGTTLFAGMPLVFVPLDHARALVAGGRPVVSAVLVDGEPDSVPDGLHVLTRSQIITEAKGPVERPILTLHLIQVLLGVVAAMIIGAVVYLASLERTRDVAVLRAVGTEGSLLALGVASQALVVAVVAATLAIALEVALAPVFPLTVHLTAGDLLAMPIVAAIVAMVSSYAAIRRTLRIDPSEAFAGAGG